MIEDGFAVAATETGFHPRKPSRNEPGWTRTRNEKAPQATACGVMFFPEREASVPLFSDHRLRPHPVARRTASRMWATSPAKCP